MQQLRNCDVYITPQKAYCATNTESCFTKSFVELVRNYISSRKIPATLAQIVASLPKTMSYSKEDVNFRLKEIPGLLRLPHGKVTHIKCFGNKAMRQRILRSACSKLPKNGDVETVKALLAKMKESAPSLSIFGLKPREQMLQALLTTDERFMLDDGGLVARRIEGREGELLDIAVKEVMNTFVTATRI